jgi:hypothetical protein
MSAQTITPELQRDLKLQKVLEFGETIFYPPAPKEDDEYIHFQYDVMFALY